MYDISGGKHWSIEHRVITQSHLAAQRILYEKTEEHKKLAQLLYKAQFLTGVQIMWSYIYTGRNETNVKKYISKLSRMGYLNKHIIRKDDRDLGIPVYSLGILSKEHLKNYPDAEDVIKKNSVASTHTILKAISANQFLVKLSNIAYVNMNHTLPSPYTVGAEFIFKKHGDPKKNMDKRNTLKIISIRNYDNDMKEIERQAYKINENCLFICSNQETLSQLQQLLLRENPNNMSRFKFTTDARINGRKSKLSNALSIFNGKDEIVYISLFDKEK